MNKNIEHLSNRTQGKTRDIWKIIQFGDIAEFKNGLNFKANEIGPSIRVLGVGDFQRKSVISDMTVLSSITLSRNLSADYLLQDGDLVFVRSNGNKELVGRCLLVYPGNEKVSYSGFTIRARLKTDKITPRFVSLLMQNGLLKKALKREGAGTNISNLNQEILQRLEIPALPPYDQVKIEELISTWDLAIEKTEQLITSKETFLRTLLNKYLKPGNRVNEKWTSSKIREFLIPRQEKAVPSKDAPLFSLTIEDGITAKTDRYNREFLVKNAEVKTYKVVYPGDIVFNPANLRWGAIARSNIDHKVVVSPIYEVLEINHSKIDPDFLTYSLTCPRQIGVFATKTEGTLIERMAVKLDAFLLTEIIHPAGINEQKYISSLFNTVQYEIDLLKKELEAYRNQKRGLMQKLLTGKWRIKLTKGTNDG